MNKTSIFTFVCAHPDIRRPSVWRSARSDGTGRPIRDRVLQQIRVSFHRDLLPGRLLRARRSPRRSAHRRTSVFLICHALFVLLSFISTVFGSEIFILHRISFVCIITTNSIDVLTYAIDCK